MNTYGSNSSGKFGNRLVSRTAAANNYVQCYSIFPNKPCIHWPWEIITSYKTRLFSRHTKLTSGIVSRKGSCLSTLELVSKKRVKASSDDIYSIDVIANTYCGSLPFYLLQWNKKCYFISSSESVHESEHFQQEIYFLKGKVIFVYQGRQIYMTSPKSHISRTYITLNKQLKCYCFKRFVINVKYTHCW